MTGLVLDAGAFIGLERRQEPVAALFERARRRSVPLVTSAVVVGQVWRGTARQTPIALALGWPTMSVADLTHADGRLIGKLLAVTGGSDVVDAHIAVLARKRNWPVVTSDPEDLKQLDPTLTLHVV